MLDTAVASIDVDGPNYRGVPALWLAERGVAFDRVAELLWTGTLPDAVPARSPAPLPRALAALVPAGTPVGRGLLAVVAVAPGLAAEGALAFVHRLAAASALLFGPRSTWAARADRALAAPCVAEALVDALGLPPSRRDPLDRALVLCAEHELNVSTFAARVAASAGADDGAALTAALAAWTGAAHGGASDQLEAALDGAPLSGSGFGHRLYPEGDPRAELLLDLARAAGPGPRTPAVERLLARGAALGPPNLDAGLVALSAALDLPLGAAGLLFAIGRCAGWIAHIREQRQSPWILRPRARYLGAR
ncbi:MAG: citrate/2-methylcitrate synthase [Myxococcota bacterium]